MPTVMQRLSAAVARSLAPAARSLPDRYRAEGRIKVNATIVHGAPEGWFLPGNGKAEWFKDHEMGPEMVIVPVGRFMMGSPGNASESVCIPGAEEFVLTPAETPQHPVTIAQPFGVGRHAVTRGQFAAFVSDTGYETSPCGGLSWRNPGFPQDDSHPVVFVSWEDAKAFATWLSRQSGRDYRLLTEAEWEYAARAGTTTPFWWGSKINPAQANYDKQQKTVAVGNFVANLWGLYQVHGNVWEWCGDPWHRNYIDAPSDGSAWLQGGNESLRVFRGGSWDRYPDCLRSAYRFWGPSLALIDELGFRVARTLNP